MLKRVFFISSVLGLALIATSQSSAANKNQKKDWRTQDYCHRQVKTEAPSFLRKDQIKFVGVDIGTNGAFKRLMLKPEALKNLPDNFVFEDNTKTLSDLSREDFYHYRGPFPDDYETPFDINPYKVEEKGDKTSFIFILMPEAWEFSEPAMSMKLPPQKWKNPSFDFPIKPFSSKIAFVHWQDLSSKKSLECNYDFNLHVTVSQSEGGKIFKTPIIIDPGGSNNGHGIP